MEERLSKPSWASAWIHLISSSSLSVRSWKSIFDCPGAENRVSFFSLFILFGGQHAPWDQASPTTGADLHWASVRHLPTHLGLWYDRFTVRPWPTSQLPSVWQLDTKSALFLSKAHFICAVGPQKLTTAQVWSLSSLQFLWYVYSLYEHCFLSSSLIWKFNLPGKIYQTKVRSKGLLNLTLSHYS